MTQNAALFVLRLGVGGMMLFAHGMPKLLGFSAKVQFFPDPIGLGPTVSLMLMVFAEVFCAAAVVAGFFTRWAAGALVIGMSVAVFIVHAPDPWARKEMALLYLVSFLSIAIAGGGKYSVDGILLGKR